MKFSELLGEPEPERDLPDAESEPISVFAQVPVNPPQDQGQTARPANAPAVPPVGPRSGLAELNVRQTLAPAPPTTESPVLESINGLEAVDDDLLPSGRHRRK